MKIAEIEKIVEELKEEVEKKIEGRAHRISSNFVKVRFNDWKKNGNDRTYIKVVVELSFITLSYDAGYINNKTGRYNSKYAKVNIQKKDFSEIFAELEERIMEHNENAEEKVERIKREEAERKAKEEAEEKAYKEFTAQKVEEVAEVKDGTVVVVNERGIYVAMLKTANNKLQAIANCTLAHKDKYDALYDIYDYLNDNNYAIPANLEKELF